MVKDVVSVKYKEHDVGAVSFNSETGIGLFEFEPRFYQNRYRAITYKNAFISKNIFISRS